MLTVKSFDGVDLQTGEYTAYLVASNVAMGTSVQAVEVSVAGGVPRDEGFNHQSQRFQVGVITHGVDPDAAADALKSIFSKGRRGEIVVEVDGSDRMRVCRVETFTPYALGPSHHIVGLFVADTGWRAITASEVVEEITASGQTWVVGNAGNAPDTAPVIRIKATAQKDASKGWQERHFVNLANRVKRGLGDWSVEITGGGYDHEADVDDDPPLSQADGRDIRVLVDGVPVPHYFGAHASNEPDTDALTIWVTPGLSAMREAHLLATITDSVPADGGELEVMRGETDAFPGRGALIVPGSGEVITYSGKTPSNASGHAAFTGIKRGQRGTAAAGATGGDPLLLAERRVEVVKGHMGVAAPVARPDAEPMIDRSSATLANTRMEWTQFYDDRYPGRPMQWARRLEARDTQAGHLYLPRAEGSPAGDLDFAYHWQEPPADHDNVNVVRRPIPVGTAGANDQIKLTHTVQNTLALELLGVTADGREYRIDRIPGPTSAGAYESNANDEVYYELALYARTRVLLSTPEHKLTPPLTAMPTYQVAATNAAGDLTQPIRNTLGADFLIEDIYVPFSFTSTPSNVGMAIYPDDGDGEPATGFPFTTGGIPSELLSSAVLWRRIQVFGINSRIWVAENVGHLRLSVTATTHGIPLWSGWPATYEGQAPWLGYRVCGDGPADPDARGQEGETATADGVGVDCDPDGVPYVSMEAAEACYWHCGELRNNTTGQRFKLDAITGEDDEIEIDVGERTVRNLTTGDDLRNVFEPSDLEGWFALAPGSNELEWVEDGVEGIEVEVVTRSTWE